MSVSVRLVSCGMDAWHIVCLLWCAVLWCGACGRCGVELVVVVVWCLWSLWCGACGRCGVVFVVVAVWCLWSLRCVWFYASLVSVAV